MPRPHQDLFCEADEKCQFSDVTYTDNLHNVEPGERSRQISVEVQG